MPRAAFHGSPGSYFETVSDHARAGAAIMIDHTRQRAAIMLDHTRQRS